MVVAALRPAEHGARLHHRRPPKLAPPDHECRIEHPPPLEVGDERCAGPVSRLAVLLHVARHVGVAVPALVIDRDEPHAPLHEPPGDQAGPGEARLLGRAAIESQRLRALVGEVHQLRRRGLEPVSHLVAGDPRGDLRVTIDGQPPAVDGRDHVECLGSQAAVGPVGGIDVEDRGTRVAKPRAGVDARQEAARPVGTAAADARPRAHHHERRQVAALAPDSVGHPRADARPAGLREAAVHEDLRGGVVELVGTAAFHDRDVINHRREVRQHLGELRPALPVPQEAILWPEHGGVWPDEGVSLAADHLRRDRFAFDGGQLRLVVEELELARGACHEELDHRLRPPGAVRGFRSEQPRRERRRRSRTAERIGEQARQRHLADANAAVAEEVPPCEIEEWVHRLTIASSRFIAARATSIQAARSAASGPASPVSFAASSSPAASRCRWAAR